MMPVETGAGAYVVNLGAVGVVGTLFGMPIEALILGAMAGAVAQAAGVQKLAEIEQAIQSHINQTVAGLGMGFTDDQSLIGKYAGYDNVFRPIAESVGKWVAEIWYLAAQDKAAIIAGKKAIPTVEEALAMVPSFTPTS